MKKETIKTMSLADLDNLHAHAEEISIVLAEELKDKIGQLKYSTPRPTDEEITAICFDDADHIIEVRIARNKIKQEKTRRLLELL